MGKPYAARHGLHAAPEDRAAYQATRLSFASDTLVGKPVIFLTKMTREPKSDVRAAMRFCAPALTIKQPLYVAFGRLRNSAFLRNPKQVAF